MAIKSKEVIDAYKKKMAAPLNGAELEAVDAREGEIDSIILKDFKGGPVFVDLAHFLFNTSSFDYNERHNAMRRELEKRYKDAGWMLKVELDDGLDGPNRSGPDYMKLTPIAYRKKN
jgi:hypothetical protein